MNDLAKLSKKLIEVERKGWIKACNKSNSGVGLTLEKELEIYAGNFEIPDFGQIEIKAKKIGSEPYITLFNATPDSYLFEIKRIHKLYGYPHKTNPEFKVFNISLLGTELKSIGGRYLFNIAVDKSKKQIIMNVYDKYSRKLIDNDCAWSFDLIKEKLYRKLNYLMFVTAERKYQSPNVYYKYISHTFYILKNFNTFLSAIENGIVRITFKISVFQSGKRKGEIHDHGTSFDIKEDDLDYIFYRE